MFWMKEVEGQKEKERRRIRMRRRKRKNKEEVEVLTIFLMGALRKSVFLVHPQSYSIREGCLRQFGTLIRLHHNLCRMPICI